MKERMLESTIEYLDWFKVQSESVQEAVRAHVKLLLEKGSSLGRPYVYNLKGGKHLNLKELQVRTRGKKYLIAFIFTGDRVCLLLTGGSTGRFGRQAILQKLIARTEALYEEVQASR